ncbi:tetratricopeptide repeat protein [Paenibacillus protaetiae]|uniref:Uncharacterized protein n=1 Tax=Paenibacillus protaetiae TaxID=2509456 RepID=A0A4P6F0S0_9BACL|nr:hypothetical protein [Paenibacillus protaetiae]QAY66597.1 hypothetical protein ET464_09460 [Paenibacillus protaetiae]
MGKLFLGFVLLSWLTGSPVIAIIIILVILYLLDRRFVGLTPSIVKPVRRLQRISNLKKRIQLSPSDVSSKLELARLLMERKQFKAAGELLVPLQETMSESAEYLDDLGYCYLETGAPDKGEAAIRAALQINPRVKYGAPYLRLASFNAKSDTSKALQDLRRFQEIQSSSCESYLRLADLYRSLGQEGDAKAAVDEGLRTYSLLPRYKRRTERAWFLRLWLRKTFRS